MSIISSTTGTTFEAGFFLVDDERCTRQSMTIAANHAQRVTRNGRTIVPMGAVIPANDATAKGILYEDVDVTDDAKPGSVVPAGTDAKLGSVVIAGTIYGDRLPDALDEAAAKALTQIHVIATSPTVTRPAAFDVEG